MASSRINFMSASFSYAPNVTKANYMETLTKFMVSGFGPFTIEKIKVTNKVVRVTTTEKKFISLPGCKLSIGGTGVAAIDDNHELTAIFSDGFSFSLDTPDAEFTNGLTYSVPSLGWTLIKQTAVLTIYYSTAAVTPFYVIITKIPVGGSVDLRYDYHTIQICYNLDFNQDPITPYPIPLTEFYQLMPIHPYTLSYTPANFNAPINWYFYGDGAMVLAAGNAGGSLTFESIRKGDLSSMSVSGFGEMKPVSQQLPLTFISGTRMSRADTATNWRTISWNNSNNMAPVLNGYISTNTTLNDAFLGSKVSNEYLYFAYGGMSYPRPVYNMYSGRRRDRATTFSNTVSDFIFTPMEVYDNAVYRVGLLPGVLTLDNRPYGIDTEPYRKFSININNREHRGVLARCTSNGGSSTGGSSATTDTDAITFLDLTGPIR